MSEETRKEIELNLSTLDKRLLLVEYIVAAYRLLETGGSFPYFTELVDYVFDPVRTVDDFDTDYLNVFMNVKALRYKNKF